MSRKYLGNKISDGQASIVLSARLDLATYEEGFKATLPAMFAKWTDLQSWAETNDFRMKFVPNSMDKIVEVKGQFTCGNYKMPYRQLWAKADYKPYRDPWANFHGKTDKVSRPRLTSLHADHVISKERVLPNNPEAWVMLFPVPGGSNSPFGSLVEKGLPDLPPISTEGYLIDGLVGFKLFSNEYPRTAAELQEQLKAIGGQVSPELHQKITNEIMAIWQPKKISQPKKFSQPKNSGARTKRKFGRAK